MNANLPAKRAAALHIKLITGFVLCLPLVFGWLAADRYDERMAAGWLFSAFVCAGWGGFLVVRYRVPAAACIGWAILNFALIAIAGSGPAQVFKSKSSCYGNLRTLEGAKYYWALEYKKTDTDTPMWKELLGKYLPELPECPGGGVYALGPLSEPPTCTIKKHREQYQPVRIRAGANNSASAR